MKLSQLAKKIRGALYDRRGVTILFALFLMLICIAVGAVILAAGTAASGRRSRIALNDQRYFSVGSAAETVRGLLDGAEVTLVRDQITTTETVYTLVVNEDGTKKRSGTGSVVSKDTEYGIHLDGSDAPLAADAEQSVLVAAVIDLVEGYTNAQAVYDEELPNASVSLEHTYELTHLNTPASLGEADFLDVTLVLRTDTNGDLYATLTAEDPETGDAYSLVETFRLSLTTRESSSTKSGAADIRPVTGDPDRYTESITKTVTNTKKDIFRWEYESTEIKR